ncbi:MAG: D-2-hydroxyacid dehydrogenase [bacterium]
MEIVILDGYTLNPGDLDWGGFEALGCCTVYDRTLPAEIAERAKDAEIVLTNKVELSQETLSKLQKLRYIGVLATGYNVVNIKAARRRGIPVTNIPTYGTNSVAQMVFAHILELTQNVGHHSQTVRLGQWSRSQDWCYWERPMIELDELTMGIVGFGRIGQRVGQIATAFGMQVIAFDTFQPSPLPSWAQMVPLDTVFKESDVVSLHCPLFPENHKFVNTSKINLMKPSAFLINTSRGPLVNEQDLADALNSDRIAGAGLDVLSTEPPSDDNPLLQAKNCSITPHISWATRAARARLMNIAVENLQAFLDNKPQNVVN